MLTNVYKNIQPNFPGVSGSSQIEVAEKIALINKMNQPGLWKNYSPDQVGYWVKNSFNKLYNRFYEPVFWDQKIPEGFKVKGIGFRV